MRWMVTGCYGQLGSDLLDLLEGEAVRASDRDTLDIADAAAVAAVVREFAPDVLINAAAYTAVDAAETDEDAAFVVNARGPAVLAAAMAAVGGRLIHVSTDYVFDGKATRPYEVHDSPAPAGAYGRTKLDGERAVLELLPDAGYVVRTAWVYGARGKNFIKTMTRLERERETLNVVDDQRGSPTWSFDLARGLVELARSQAVPGIYHCTGTGDTTWCGFAKAIFSQIGADPDRVRGITTDQYPLPAPRPAYSVLSDAAWLAAGLTPMPAWQDALSRAFEVSGEAFRSA